MAGGGGWPQASWGLSVNAGSLIQTGLLDGSPVLPDPGDFFFFLIEAGDL